MLPAPATLTVGVETGALADTLGNGTVAEPPREIPPPSSTVKDGISASQGTA